MMTAVVVFMVELFIPLSAGAEFKIECRTALLRMELEGGLTPAIEEELLKKLRSLDFAGLSVEGTGFASLGENLTLRVEAYYPYNGITGLFERGSRQQRMTYEKTTISRVVVK